MKKKYVVLEVPISSDYEAPSGSKQSFTVEKAVSWRANAGLLADDLALKGKSTTTRANVLSVETLAPEDARERKKEGCVIYIAPVMPMRLIAPIGRPKPAARRVNLSWGIQAVGAHTCEKWNGSGIVVAVLDTGIDAKHPAFKGVTFEHRNFTAEAADDQHGHGTHCAGTIFGRAVDGVRIGIAPGIERAVICKVLGDGGGDSAQIASAIYWSLERGAHVISMSLGLDFPGYVKQMIAQNYDVRHATSLALEGYRANLLLFERLAGVVRMHGLMPGAKPTLLIAAAGNESEANGVNPFRISVSPPAVSEGIISVAAAGLKDKKWEIAPFSNSGAKVTGPGVDILSAQSGGGLVTMSGTSMATPHVAGVAALWAHQLRESDDWKTDTWIGRIIGGAGTLGFAEGTQPADRGAGMVCAPRSTD